MKKQEPEISPECLIMIRGINDTQDVLNGKWKTAIIGVLYYRGALCFMDLKRAMEGIAPKMLSKELKDLEVNQLITRTIQDTRPITVEYNLTELGRSLNAVLQAMGNWGIHYRHQIVATLSEEASA